MRDQLIDALVFFLVLALIGAVIAVVGLLVFSGAFSAAGTPTVQAEPSPPNTPRGDPVVASAPPVLDLPAVPGDSPSLPADPYVGVLSPSLGAALWAACQDSIGDGWLPTEEAFTEHIMVRVRAVAPGLRLGDARRLLGDQVLLELPQYGGSLAGDGTLGDVFDLPAAEDAARLWRLEGVPGAFADALVAWHRAAEAEELSWERTGPAVELLREYARLEQARGDRIFAAILTQDRAYPHWILILELFQALAG